MSGLFENFSLVETSLSPHSFIAQHIIKNRHKVVAIFGPSGGGKTSFSLAMAQVLGEDHTVLISVDDYWKYTRAEMKNKRITGYDWEARDKLRFLNHLKELQQGHIIAKPIFDYVHELPTDRTERVVPKDIVLLEATLDFTDIASCIIFTYAPDEVLIERRLKRDRSLKSFPAIQNLETYVRTISIPAYKEKLLPLAQHADFIVDTNLNKLYRKKICKN